MTSQERHEIRYQRRKAERERRKRERYGDCDDFDKVFTFDHLLASAYKSFRGVGWKASTQTFRANLLLNVQKLYTELRTGKYRSKGFYEFDIMERGKPRHIKSVHISERVVQKCLCDYSLVPIQRRTLIYDNGACIEGKGIDFSVNRLKTHLQRYFRETGSNDGYALIVDFSHYFDTINHELLKGQISQKYTDERLIRLIHMLIDNFGGIEGLGLGSQISQICALAFPDKLDHIIKERLGIRHYGRYMDDAYLIHGDKGKLCKCLEVIKEFCDAHGITLNPKKTRITKLARGIPFLKRRFILTKTGKVLQTPNKKGIVRMRRKLKAFATKVEHGKMSKDDVRNSFVAWYAHISKTNAYRSMYRLRKEYAKIYGVDTLHKVHGIE